MASSWVGMATDDLRNEGSGMSQMGFGIAGAGSIAQVHAAAIEACEGARLVAVWSRSESSARQLAARYDVPAFHDYDRFLQVSHLDAVAVCTPSGNHLEPARAAARQGKHVMVEKPIEVTLQRADRMIKACEEAEVQLGVIFQSRFLQSVQRMKRALEEGWLGEPVMGTAEVKWYRPPEYYARGSWHGTLALDGGGALINQSIHTIDLLLWLMGPVESVAAFATRRRYGHIEGEDTAAATLKFRSGALGSIIGATSIYPGFSRKLGIHGTGGSLVLEGNELISVHFEDSSREGEFQISTGVRDQGFSDPRISEIEPHQRQYEDFVKRVGQGHLPAVDGREGRRSLELVLAIYKSGEEGRRVPLPL